MMRDEIDRRRRLSFVVVVIGIGIGPSSLHTVWPIVAVACFFEDLDATGSMAETCRVVC